MKEPYVEGIASRNGHESCAGSHEVTREALDSGMYRLGIEPRKRVKLECRHGPDQWKAKSRTSISCEMLRNSTWSKTLYMYRNSLRGNREILQLTLIMLTKVRIENPIGVKQ